MPFHGATYIERSAELMCKYSAVHGTHTNNHKHINVLIYKQNLSQVAAQNHFNSQY